TGTTGRTGRSYKPLPVRARIRGFVVLPVLPVLPVPGLSSPSRKSAQLQGSGGVSMNNRHDRQVCQTCAALDLLEQVACDCAAHASEFGRDGIPDELLERLARVTAAATCLTGELAVASAAIGGARDTGDLDALITFVEEE